MEGGSDLVFEVVVFAVEGVGHGADIAGEAALAEECAEAVAHEEVGAAHTRCWVVIFYYFGDAGGHCKGREDGVDEGVEAVVGVDVEGDEEGGLVADVGEDYAVKIFPVITYSVNLSAATYYRVRNREETYRTHTQAQPTAGSYGHP